MISTGKFNLTINAYDLAGQIASLINAGGQIQYHLNKYSVLSGNVKYIVEIDRERVVGTIALDQKSDRVTELKFLCVHPEYRRQGLGKRLLEIGIKNSSTEYVYGTVRSDNSTNIRNNLRVGMRPIGKHHGRGCNIIIFAKRRGTNDRHSLYEKRA